MTFCHIYGRYEGGIVALFHLLITKEDKVLALQRAFYRNDMGLPNITNLMSTVFVLLVVVWYALSNCDTAKQCDLFQSGSKALRSTSSSSPPRCAAFFSALVSS